MIQPATTSIDLSSIPQICRDVTKSAPPGKVFTIGTLVTKLDQYSAMVESFVQGGFTSECCDYLYVNNISGNRFDAYSGLNQIIAKAKTPYIILCHQDLTLIEDGYDELLARLAELDRTDPLWAVAGNAGGTGKGQYAVHITNRSGSITQTGTLPARAESLDENFLVLKRASGVGFSQDLAGFHFYGTDLVVQAELRGGSAYAIDFHLHHHGEGKMDREFFEAELALVEKYARQFRTRARQGLSRNVWLTPSRLLLVIQRMKLLRKIRRLGNKTLRKLK